MKKNSKIKKVVIVIVAVVFVLALAAVIVWKTVPNATKKEWLKSLTKSQVVRDIAASEVKDAYTEKVQDTTFNEDEVVVSEEALKKLTGYTNILLFGIDARTKEFDEGSNSDTMIILSINNDTGAIRMVSVYRDTLFRLIGDKYSSNAYRKANSAYARGGAVEALSTLNTNLDLDITDYVVVNFEGLTDVIDVLGGVDVTVSESEKDYINRYSANLAGTVGKEVTPLSAAGDVHLNGVQATSYCRIRSTPFTDKDGTIYRYDYGRTARQRYVLKQLVSAAKNTGITKLLPLVKDLMNLNTEERTVLKTSLQYDDVMDLLPVMIDYKLDASAGFPFTHESCSFEGDDPVVPAGLAYNVSELHRFLFDDEAYEPSDDVKNISWEIQSRTGIGEKTLNTAE